MLLWGTGVPAQFGGTRTRTASSPTGPAADRFAAGGGASRSGAARGGPAAKAGAVCSKANNLSVRWSVKKVNSGIQLKRSGSAPMPMPRLT